ncbi:NAD(P)-binding protein [Aureobasidium sp. EXF-8845]|nr:NAD(P)-binding protein [Aureobasidium sp. EXF-8845]KAI4855899.1 NAD(P)-binding protein [Aureobasidium sp. EXF-8846]
MTIALTSATGKLGGGVLNDILEHKLIDTKELVICTSSDPEGSRFDALRAQNIELRQANFNDASSLEKAYSGCERLFLVSSPLIEMDFNDAPLWQGREKHHRTAIDAAVRAGVKHIYYTSLAFGSQSEAGVMRAHLRTEKYLHELEDEGKIKATIIREGLYSGAWPLAFGYYFGLRNETRDEVVVAGDGPLSFASIADITFGTAKIIAAPSEFWIGKTVTLSLKETWTLQDMADLISKSKGQKVTLKVVSKKEFDDYYTGRGLDRASVEWWSSAYESFKDGECAVKDPTLEDLLKEAGKKPELLGTTIKNMLE